MTKDEALKLALLVLWTSATPKCEEAITAIKAVLAQPDQNLACKSTQARLAASWGYVKVQPEQTPVAYMHLTDEGSIRLWSKSSPESIEAAIGVKPIPLYPSPTKRRPDPYDQTALELCDQCGWKAVIPGEPCLVCTKQRQPLTEAAVNDLFSPLVADGRTKIFTAKNWFQAGLVTGEAAHGIGDKT
jgi:hypothetical protein